MKNQSIFQPARYHRTLGDKHPLITLQILYYSRKGYLVIFGLNTLKVPKREIFDRSDFPDFFTIKPLRVGDFGVKIEKKLTNI